MIGCTETITLIHHVAGETDEYICHTVNNCSWFAKTTITTSADGAKPVNSYEVRIFDQLVGHEPEPGDYCARGVVANITKPADLKGLDYFRVSSTGNNCRGGIGHWRVSGQ